MHINQLKESKYLKKEDCGNGILVTIKGLTHENMAMEGEPQELKYILHFMEQVKPMALNSTNAQIIAQIAKNPPNNKINWEDTDSWPGVRVVLYADPNISYQGRLIGGIRARAPRNITVAPAPQPITPPAPMPHVERQATQLAESDDVPF